MDRGLPLCPVCDKPLISWASHADPYDWYCSTPHGKLGEGLFFRDEWDGEAFSQRPNRSEAEIKSMLLMGWPVGHTIVHGWRPRTRKVSTRRDTGRSVTAS